MQKAAKTEAMRLEILVIFKSPIEGSG
jgi:hypothetical protein